MKYLKYFETYISPEEKRTNNILDIINKSGMDSISPDELELLKNKGEIKPKEKYIGIPGELEFDFERVEDQGSDLKVFGNLIYKGEIYYGWFTIPTIEDNRGLNLWDFVKDKKEFDPDPDDLYDLDSMIQEIEFDYVGE